MLWPPWSRCIQTMAKALLTWCWTFLGTTGDFRAFECRRPCTARATAAQQNAANFLSFLEKQQTVEIGDEFLRLFYYVLLFYWDKGVDIAAAAKNRQRRCKLPIPLAGFAAAATSCGLQMYRYHQKILAALKSALKSAFPLWKSWESDLWWFLRVSKFLNWSALLD